MIKRFNQIFSGESGDLSTVGIVDYDQRRVFYLIGPRRLVGRQDGVQYAILERHIHRVSSDTKTISVDDNGRLKRLAPDLPRDIARFSPQYTLDGVVRPPFDSSLFHGWPTIPFRQLTEVNRLDGGVDLVRHPDYPGQLFVFKYALIDMDMGRLWNELLVLASLPAHPSTVPFHKIVVSDVDSRIIGITMEFVDGGGFQHVDQSLPFKLKWLKQLTEVLDFLHLKMGIVHGSLSIGNLLLDLQTDSLRISGFGHAKEASLKRAQNELQQARRLVHELVTKDRPPPTTFGLGVPPVGLVTTNEMPGWPAEGVVDCIPAALREHVDTWIGQRGHLPYSQPMCVVKFQNPDIPAAASSKTTEGDAFPLELESHAIPWQRPPYDEAYPGHARQNHTGRDTCVPMDEVNAILGSEYPRDFDRTFIKEVYGHIGGLHPNLPEARASFVQESALGRADVKQQPNEKLARRPPSDLPHEIFGHGDHPSIPYAEGKSHYKIKFEVNKPQGNRTSPHAPEEIPVTRDIEPTPRARRGRSSGHNMLQDHSRYECSAENPMTPEVVGSGKFVIGVEGPSTDLSEELPRSKSAPSVTYIATDFLDRITVADGLQADIYFQEGVQGADNPMQQTGGPSSPTSFNTGLVRLGDESQREEVHGGYALGNGSENLEGVPLNTNGDQENMAWFPDGVGTPPTSNPTPGVAARSFTTPSPHNINGDGSTQNAPLHEKSSSPEWFCRGEAYDVRIAQDGLAIPQKHLNETGNRDDSPPTPGSTNRGESGESNNSRSIFHIPGLQEIAVKALGHRENSAPDQQGPQTDTQDSTVQEDRSPRNTTSQLHETPILGIEETTLLPERSPVRVQEDVGFDQGSTAEKSAEECHHNGIEEGQPNINSTAKGVKPRSVPGELENSEAETTSELAPASPRDDQNTAALKLVPTASWKHQAVRLGSASNQTMVNGRTPLPTIIVGAEWQQDSNRKWLNTADSEWSFEPFQSVKKTKAIEAESGRKERLADPYLNSWTDVARRKRMEPDTEMDLEAEILGPGLPLPAKRSKVAAVIPIPPRPRKRKAKDMKKAKKSSTGLVDQYKASQRSMSKSNSRGKGQEKSAVSDEFFGFSESDDEPLSIQRTRESKRGGSLPGAVGMMDSAKSSF